MKKQAAAFFRPRSVFLAMLIAVLCGAQAFAVDTYEPDDSAAAAKPIAAGDIQSGRSIDPAGDKDWVSFSLTELSKVILRVDQDPLSSGFPLIRVYDATETELNNDFGTLTILLPAGSYFASVEDSGGAATIDDYTLRFSVISAAPDLYEPDNGAGEAKAIQLGVPQPGHTIASVGDADWVTFTLAAEMDIAIDATVALGTVRVTVLDSYLNEIVSAQTRVFPHLAAGKYYVRVEDDGNDDITAAYTLNFWRRDGPDPYEEDDTPDQARWIGNSGPKQTHNFHQSGDTDWVKFYAEAGMSVDLNTISIGTSANPLMELFRGDGTTPIDQATGLLSWDVDATGFYLVRVTNQPSTAFGAETVYTIGVPLHPPGIIPGTLVGVVKDKASGNAITNALVEITDFAGLKAQTDDRGLFVFPALPGGSYTVKASAPGFSEAGPSRVSIGSGSTVRNFELAANGDINVDGSANAVDVQLVVNAVLGLDIGGLDADVNSDASLNALDVQAVVNAVLGA